jgi:hypothetical protein
MSALRYVQILAITLFLLLMFGTARTIAAPEPNVGRLKVAGVEHPRQVPPSARFSLIIDAEYAIHESGTVKASLFEGSLRDLGSRLWESDSVALTGGGDRVWVVNLTAPSMERNWSLTVIVFYLDAGRWSFYNDSNSGPGYAEMTLKVAKLAELEVNLGTPNLPVTVNASTQLTSKTGQVEFQLPVGQFYQIATPPVVQFDNSTRLVFVGWQDGFKASQRTVKLDGDLKIGGSYKTQYLLQVNSIAPGYSSSTWYDAGSDAALAVKRTVPMSWPLGVLGLSYNFKGWSGAANSGSTQLNITMNGPRVVTADFVVDYTSLVIPTIIVAGVLGAFALFVLRRRIPARSVSVEEVVSEDVTSKVCRSCGKAVADDWAHCVYCGKTLNATEPV